jgi:hypothetical protein
MARSAGPVPSEESLRANWKYWLVRKAAEKIAAAMKNCVITAELKEIRPNRLSGIIGSRARLSHQTKPMSIAAPRSNPVRFFEVPQPS